MNAKRNVSQHLILFLVLGLMCGAATVLAQPERPRMNSLERPRQRIRTRPDAYQPAGFDEPIPPAIKQRISAIALKQAKPMIEESGFSVEKSLAVDLPPVLVDAAALSRAIQNLIQNAVKYCDKGRRLIIRTFKTDTKHGTEVLLGIEDEGKGISSEHLPHIFEPFYRSGSARSSQVHGTGLGLYIVRETLAAMGGSIDAKSSPGKGSTFRIHLSSLPASKADSAAQLEEDNPDYAV